MRLIVWTIIRLSSCSAHRANSFQRSCRIFSAVVLRTVSYQEQISCWDRPWRSRRQSGRRFSSADLRTSCMNRSCRSAVCWSLNSSSRCCCRANAALELSPMSWRCRRRRRITLSAQSTNRRYTDDIVAANITLTRKMPPNSWPHLRQILTN